MVIAEILPEILLGEFGDIRPEPLKQARVSLIVNLRKKAFSKTRDKPYLTSRQVWERGTFARYIWLPVSSDPDVNLFEFQQEIMTAVYRLGRIRFVNGDRPRHVADRTLVYCTAGMHRSPLVIALHLWMDRKKEVLSEIYKQRKYKNCSHITFEDFIEFVSMKARKAGRPPVDFPREWLKGMMVK